MKVKLSKETLGIWERDVKKDFLDYFREKQPQLPQTSYLEIEEFFEKSGMIIDCQPLPFQTDEGVVPNKVLWFPNIIVFPWREDREDLALHVEYVESREECRRVAVEVCIKYYKQKRDVESNLSS